MGVKVPEWIIQKKSYKVWKAEEGATLKQKQIIYSTSVISSMIFLNT